MSKSTQGPHNRPGKRHHAAKAGQTVRSNRMTLARKIARDARASAENDNEEAFERLCRSIRTCLDNGNEKILEEAVEHVGDDPATIKEILETTQYCATTRYGLQNLDTGEFLVTELIAIPLFLAVSRDERRKVPRVLDGKDQTWLAKSFRQHGLKHPTAESVMILPELWQAAEIFNFPLPVVSRLTLACQQGFADSQSVMHQWILKAYPEKVELRGDETSLCLRYVLGAWLHPVRTEMPFLLDENDEKLDRWQDAVAEHLTESLRCRVIVFDPDTVYDALRDGWTDFHYLAQRLQRESLFEKAGVLPAEVKAVVSTHAHGDEISEVRIGFYHYPVGKPEFIGGTIRPVAPFEDLELLADGLFSDEEAEQFGAMEIVPDIQTEEEGQASEREAPAFAAPISNILPALAVTKPARGQWH